MFSFHTGLNSPHPEAILYYLNEKRLRVCPSEGWSFFRTEGVLPTICRLRAVSRWSVILPGCSFPHWPINGILMVLGNPHRYPSDGNHLTNGFRRRSVLYRREGHLIGGGVAECQGHFDRIPHRMLGGAGERIESNFGLAHKSVEGRSVGVGGARRFLNEVIRSRRGRKGRSAHVTSHSS